MKKILLSLGLVLTLVLTLAVAPVNATTECAHENLKFQYYLEGQTKPDTCLQEAVAKFKCEDCEKIVYQKVSGEHDYQVAVEDATCTTPQRIVERCSHCKNIKTEEVLSPALGHDWNETHIDATCTTPAGVAKACKNCDAVEDFVAYPESSSAYEAAKGHKYGEKTVVAPTCTSKGYTLEVCKVCDYEHKTNETAVNPEGHKAKLVDTILEPTCTVDGVGKYICEYCEETLTYTAIPASHKYGEPVAKADDAPTCGTAGHGVATCADCGATKEVEMPATGNHDYALESNTPADCGHTGLKVEKCTVCNDEKETVLPIEGKHDFKEEPRDADCTNPQRVVEVCSKCGTEGKSYPVAGSKELGHDWNYTYYPATCDHASGYTATCKRPGCKGALTFTEFKEGDKGYVAALEHKYGEAKVVEATCKDGGYTYQECSVCGHVNKTNETPVNPENHVAELVGSPLKEATCTVAGVGKYQCKHCEVSLGYKSIAPSHKWDNGTVTTAATCTEKGVKTYKCTVEGCEETKTEEIALAAHDYQKDTAKSKDNNCGVDGLLVQVCSVCGDKKEEKLPATGLHKFVDTNGVNDADCENPQTVGEKCSVCGAKGEVHPVEGSKPLGHVLVKKAVAATCENPSGYYEECSRSGCNHKTEVTYYAKGDKGYVAALGHDWKTETKAATCKEAGYSKKVCKRAGCDAVAEETVLPIDPNNHTLELKATLKAATCTVAGVGKYECKDCEFSSYKTIEAQHTWDNGTVTKDPTCTEKGVLTFKCTFAGCEGTKTEEIALAKHDYQKDTTKSKDNNCGVDGLLVEVCSVCKDEKETKLAATGKHNFVEGAIDADCENPQRVGEKCSVCGTVGPKSESVIGSKPLGHNYVKVEVSATCTTAAGYYEKCTRCDDEKDTVYYAEGDEKYVAALGHDWETLTKAATCKEAGYSKKVCKRTGCEAVEEETVLPINPNNHTLELATTLKAATCTVAGVGKYECKDCEYSTYKTIEAHHTWNDGTVTKPATCTEKGIKTFKCTAAGCEGTKTEEIALAAHDYQIDASKSKAADCGHKGLEVKVCSVCKDEVKKELPITGKHVKGEGVIAATCTSPDKVGIICTVCNYEFETVEVQGSKALGHDYVRTATAATCENASGYIDKCSRCDDKVTHIYTADEKGYVAALGHNYEEKEVKATCAAKGETYKQCKNCNKVIDKVELPIDAENHDYKLVTPKLKEESCTVAGVGKYECSNPKCKSTVYRTIEAHHTYGAVIVVTPATCATAGAGTQTCLECSHVNDVVIAATGEHILDTDITPATCAEAGKKVTTCINCDYEKTEVIPATGKHTFVEGVKDATCTSAAKVGIICEDCGLEKEVVLVENSAPLGHDWVETYAAADCTHPAGSIRTCSRCDIPAERIDFEEDSELYVAPLGHDWKTVTKAATCKDKGYTEQVCDRAGCTAKQNKTELAIDPTNHTNEKETVLQAPTCTVAGVGKYECKDCKTTTYKSIAPEHTWGTETVITTATCGKDGKGSHTCTVCTKTENTVIPATGKHNLTTKTTDATCVKAGSKVITCGNAGCEYKVTEVIPATGKHTYVEDVIAATCTEAPQIGFVCKSCNGVDPTRKPEPVEDGKPLGHDIKETHIDATCTSPAGFSTKCSRCDYEVEFTAYPEDSSVYKPALGHNYQEVVQEGYCNTKGYTAKVCKNCGDTKDKQETGIDATNHILEEPVILKTPTCTTAGVGKYSCHYCDHVEYKTIAASHTWSEIDQVNANATIVYNACTVAGCEGIKVVSCIKFDGFDGKEYSSLAKVEAEIAAIEASIVKFASTQATVTAADETSLVLTISTTADLKAYSGVYVLVNGVAVQANAEGKFVYTTDKPAATTNYEICYATEIHGQLVLAKVTSYEYQVA